MKQKRITASELFDLDAELLRLDKRAEQTCQSSVMLAMRAARAALCEAIKTTAYAESQDQWRLEHS